MKEERIHGGREQYDNSQDWLDLSVNVNPYGPSPALIEVVREASFSNYPDPNGRDLKRALATKHQRVPTSIHLGNGAAEIFWTLVRSHLDSSNKRALIFEPTFSEFAIALAAHNFEIDEIRSHANENFVVDIMAGTEKILTGNYKFVYLCNPNSPTGTYIEPEIIARLASNNESTLFVLDLAFIEMSHRFMDFDYIYPKNVITIFSLTKDHSIPGLRIGYAIGCEQTIKKMDSFTHTWNLNSLAIAAGIVASSESLFVRNSFQKVEINKKYLCDELDNLQIPYHTGICPFVLIYMENQADLQERLLNHGFLIRDCKSYDLPGWYRIFPIQIKKLKHFIHALTHIISSPRSKLKFTIQATSKSNNSSIQRKIDQKTKPIGSLGRLEELAFKIALIQNKEHLNLDKPRIILFAGDHGLTEEGTSPYPQSVTFEMVRNFINGGAAINIFAKQHGIQLDIVDTGIKQANDWEQVISLRVGEGTKNCLHEPAMTKEQLDHAIQNGASLVKQAFLDGCRAIGFGEMGIGNSSAAALITSALTDQAIEKTVGRGTGCNDQQLSHKATILGKVLAKHTINHPLDAMRCFGGFEMATALGAILQSCELGLVTLIDGFIMSSVALIACELDPNVKDYLIFCHKSASPGHRYILDKLNVRPILDLDMRLGEGSGVAVAWPIIQSACEFYNSMASFSEAEVSQSNG